MKKLYNVTIFLGLTLFSCQGGGQKTEERKISYKQIMQGNWIPNNYIEDLKKTMSPLASSNILSGYSELAIDTSQIKGDSLYVAGGWNNHEGGGFTVYFRQGQTNTSFPTNNIDYDNKSSFTELGYEINNTDNSLILSQYNNDKKIIDKAYYTKTLGTGTSLEEGLQYFVNSILMAGKYKLLNGGQTVEFTNSGQVKGLANFQKYTIQTDFVVKADNDINNIYFDIYSKIGARFAYKINKDTLEFYTTKSDSTMGRPMIIDSLQYRLVRQR